MSRDSQQIAGAATSLLKLAQKKLGTAGLIGLVVAAVIYLVVIQPWVATRFGVTLPTLVDISEPPASYPAPRTPPSAKTENPQRHADGGDLSDVLTETGRDTYRSAAGLRYTRGSQHGTRLAHLMSHTRDESDRVGQHGVFDSDDPATVVRLVDEAYMKALAGEDSKSDREGDQTDYMIDMKRRVGYVGGQSGNRRGKPPAHYIRLVVQGDRLITAFPVRP
jgi:hypothetical protein